MSADDIASVAAGLVAGIVSAIDLERDLYIPRRRPPLSGAALAAGFVTLHVVLAVLLVWSRVGGDFVNQLSAPLRGLVLGIGYLAVLRSKIYTLHTAKGEIDVGPEEVYDKLRGFFYSRILEAVRPARIAELAEYAVARTLEQLGLEARLRIDDDPLRDADAKMIDKKWLLDTLEDAHATPAAQKEAIANFVLTGRRLSS